MQERDPLGGTPRVLLATEALYAVSDEDIALASPIAIGIMRAELSRLVQLTDERMRERP